MISFGKLYLCRDDECVLDPTYRYKIDIPEFVTTHKKGTDVTLFKNITSFIDQLEFDSELIMKMMSSKMSCQYGIDKNTNSYFFKTHEQNFIGIICEIISKYLLCVGCGKPEIRLGINKSGNLYQRCKACGIREELANTSVNDKMYDILLKFVQKKITR